MTLPTLQRRLSRNLAAAFWRERRGARRPAALAAETSEGGGARCLSSFAPAILPQRVSLEDQTFRNPRIEVIGLTHVQPRHPHIFDCADGLLDDRHAHSTLTLPNKKANFVL